jgi:Arc/MetJ-type ribon-helix-helix transcriptional regulator
VVILRKEYHDVTIHLPPHIESSIQAAVHSGRFGSLDEAMTEAASLLVQWLNQEQAQPKPAVEPPSDPLLGAWRDDADLLDEIVEHAMKVREERPWRLAPGE